VLDSRGLLHEGYLYWIGFGSLIGFTVLFNLGYTLALTYLNRMYHSKKYDRLCFHQESEIVMDFGRTDSDVFYISSYLIKSI